MIIDVEKYLFLGVKKDLNAFFATAQKMGFIEFIPKSKKKSVDYPQATLDIISAIKILKRQPSLETYPPLEDVDLSALCATIISKSAEIEKLEEEMKFVKSEISRIKPLGNFSLSQIEDIEKGGKKVVQFFCIKTAKANKIPVSNDLIYLATDFDLDYFISIADQKMKYKGMLEMRFECSLSDLKKRKIEIAENIHSNHEYLVSHANYQSKLQAFLKESLDVTHLVLAKSEVNHPLKETLFSIEAWVPSNKKNKLKKLLQDFAVCCEQIAIENDDRVPTYMENKGFDKLGEDLVHIYDTPSPKDKDPSPFVLWAFVVFYAMIISDAGYGIIYLGLALFLKWKFPNVGASIKRLLKIFTMLACSIVLWGVVTGSYFGIDLLPDNFLSRASFLSYLSEKKAAYHMKEKDDVYEYWVEKYPELKEVSQPDVFLEKGYSMKEGRRDYEIINEFKDNILIEVSLMVGILHLSISLLRFFFRSYSNIGWVLFLAGGYLFFPSMLDATSIINFTGLIRKATAHEFGVQLLFGGIGLAMLLAIIQNKLKGIAELTRLIEIFADVLSYLRLYALGLAGMILASTFNGIGANVGFAAGFFILLLGHGINIVIGAMGGIIHGLRLNFIEWYHYSFEGGGKVFNPLKLLKTSSK